MAKSHKDSDSLPQDKAKNTKAGPTVAAPVPGTTSDCCTGWTGPGAGLQICVPIGGGAFVCQFVPNPPNPGRKVLCIEGDPPVIFWGDPPGGLQAPQAPAPREAGNGGQEVM